MKNDDALLGDEPSLLAFPESEEEIVVEEEAPTDIQLFIGTELYRFTKIDSLTQFTALPEQLQFYYHYITEACWCGSLIVFFQTSAESPAILLFLLKLMMQQSLSELRMASEENGVTGDDFGALVMYAARFFSSRGNWHENHKFFPLLSQDVLFTIMESSYVWSAENYLMLNLWKHIVVPMYSASPDTDVHFQGPGEREDARVVMEYLTSHSIPFWNVRFTKSLTREGIMYDIRLASVDETEDSEYELGPEMRYFKVTMGDYAFILKQVIRSLLTAKLYTPDVLEKEIIDRYVTSFQTGSQADHKEGSRLWMNTEGTYVEWYLGFIQLLQHIASGFAEFQGFVGLQNMGMYNFYEQFIASAGNLIHLLPWGNEFEKETFITPKLKIVDLIMFCGSKIPSMKHVPEYETIRDTEGFKNIIFSNFVFNNNIEFEETFLHAEDIEMLLKYAKTAHKVHLGLKLVVGYGSGKLFRKEGKRFNFPVRRLRHPILNDKIRTWYQDGETFSSKFGDLGATLEDCRATCIALYLSTFTEVLNLFNIPDEEIEFVSYAAWLLQIYSSVVESLHGYDAQKKQWIDCKAQASFVILRMLLEVRERVVHISEPEHGKRIVIHLYKDKIASDGRRALSDFVRQLHIYKCTADVNSAKNLYDHYSVVPEEGRYPLGRWKVLTTAVRHLPIRLYVHCNTLHVRHDDDLYEFDQAMHKSSVARDTALSGEITQNILVPPRRQPDNPRSATHNNPKSTKQVGGLVGNTVENLASTSKATNVPEKTPAVVRSRVNKMINSKPTTTTLDVESWTKLSKSGSQIIDVANTRKNHSNESNGSILKNPEGNVGTEIIKEIIQNIKIEEAKKNTGEPAAMVQDEKMPGDMPHLKQSIEINDVQTSPLDRAEPSICETSLIETSDWFHQLVRTVKEMAEDVMPEKDKALLRAFHDRPYRPMFVPASVTDLRAGRGVALELKERILKYGEDAVGSRFQILIERESDISKDVASDSDVSDVASEESSEDSELELKRPAYPMIDGLPEGINVKDYPLKPEGLVESFLDKCPRDVVMALTQHFIDVFRQDDMKEISAITIEEQFTMPGETETFIKSVNFG